ncbi:MAG: hypothetical protein OXQ31_14765 [Spirochaetaceae bacterium]|nr:hypothetical protein [Spirochaetaceae bacterium]
MSESKALRDRLNAELDAAIAAALEAAARDRHRPITEVGPTDATALLASVARVAHFNREYDAGARTVAKLSLPKRWPLPTAERMARWLLKNPENLTLASAVAEAAMLTPADEHTEHERNAHHAAEQWLLDFREPYELLADGAPGWWTPDRWLSFAVLCLSDLVVTYLGTKRQRQPLYDLVAAWQRCPAKSLFETGNFRPDVLATATDVRQATETGVGQVSSLYLMSEEFMLLAKSELKNSDFLQRGRIRYSAGIFCLGHALELTYKLLLLKDRGTYPTGHNFERLFGCMTKEDKHAICQIVRDAGWDSCDHFHDFMANDIRFTDRKYYDVLSSLDHWTHDLSDQNLDHKLWPQVVRSCEHLHRYAASTIWKDPTLPSEP